MPEPLVVIFGLGLTLVVLIAKPRLALGVTLATVLLVPGTLVIPNGISFYPTVLRMVSLALLANVVIGVWTGRFDRSCLRPRRVHLLVGLLVGVSMVNGVALAIPAVSASQAYPGFVLVLDQVVFFVAVLAAVRIIDDPAFVLRLVVALVAAAALVAVWEWATGKSWAAFFFHDLPGQRANQIVKGLETRGGDLVRVRVAADFALEFGWILAMAFPLVLVAASRMRTLFAAALPVLVALAVYWSNARSAVAGLVVAALLVLALSRVDVRLARLIAAGGLIALVLVLTVSEVRRPFTVAQQTHSVDLRVERLRLVTDLAAARPYRGLGFHGLQALGIATTDTSFVLVYAQLGVIGLVVFVATLLGALGSTIGGLRAPPGRERALAAAATSGVVLAIAAAGAYDLFSIPASLRFVWLFVAIGIWMGERHPPIDPSALRASPRVGVRTLAPAVALATGLGIAWLTPSPASATFRFETVPAGDMATYAGSSAAFFGKIRAQTVCSVIDGIDRSRSDIELTCRPLPRAVDVGRLRIQARDAPTVRRTVAAIERQMSRDLPGVVLHAEEISPRGDAKPTWARTAPIWLTLGVGLLGGILPPIPYGRALGWQTNTPLDEIIGAENDDLSHT